MNTFGFWLREQRINMGLTMKEFAIKAGLSYVHISNIERNVMAPGIKSIRKLSKVLGMEYADLHQIIKEHEIKI